MPELEDGIERTAELAGFFAAHAVWCVSDAETLTPLLAFEKRDGSRLMERFASDDMGAAIEQGRKWLTNNPERAVRAVLVSDGYVTLQTGKIDALIVEAHQFMPEASSFMMAIPYRRAADPRGFAVHRPKFLACEGMEPDFMRIGTAFFRGASGHDKGIEVWNTHLDESL
ncbi:MAG: hypothetical protein M3Y56_12860 [Armatimonadota bacterium]|nr:hypothetical protein [Armatimonadota bacterium]